MDTSDGTKELFPLLQARGLSLIHCKTRTRAVVKGPVPFVKDIFFFVAIPHFVLNCMKT